MTHLNGEQDATYGRSEGYCYTGGTGRSQDFSHFHCGAAALEQLSVTKDSCPP